MDQAEREGRAGSVAGGVVEDVAAEHRHEEGFIAGARAPTQGSAGQVREIADSERLRVAAVAPVGVEKAERAVLAAGFGGASEVGEGGVVPANEGHPRGGARTDVEGYARRGEVGGFAVEGMVRFVAPGKRDEVRREVEIHAFFRHPEARRRRRISSTKLVIAAETLRCLRSSG